MRTPATGAKGKGKTPSLDMEEAREGDAALRRKRGSRGHKQSFEVEIAAIDPQTRARLTNMWALPNLALLLSYFAIGFAMTFTGTPLTAYVVSELNVGAAQLNICGTMLALPWSFKVCALDMYICVCLYVRVWINGSIGGPTPSTHPIN